MGEPGMVISRKLMSSMRSRLFSIKGANRRRMPTFTRMRGSLQYIWYM
jgi:hypothetical protein